MAKEQEHHPKPQQLHTPEGPPVEYICEFAHQVAPPPVPKEYKEKRGVLTTIGKIFSFLHR